MYCRKPLFLGITIIFTALGCGLPEEFIDNGDGTVTDYGTGLVWQQVDDDTQRDWFEATDYCNDLSLAGYTDWRLPHECELQSLVDYEDYSPAIDTMLFPDTESHDYWSSSTLSASIYYAWYVDFASGQVSDHIKYYNTNVFTRCVRGVSIPQSFTDNGDGTVTDNTSGRMWQQSDDNTGRNWQQAHAYCDSLTLAGHTDWRLPDIKELRGIVDNTVDYPAINGTYYPGTDSDPYWSSTSVASTPTRAWYVNFNLGYVIHQAKTVSTNVCVRCIR